MYVYHRREYELPAQLIGRLDEGKHVTCRPLAALTDRTIRPTNICLQSHLILLLVGLSTSFLQSTRRTGRGEICRGFQRQRYASFSCHAYRSLSNIARWAIVHVLHQSTSPIIIPFSTYFIFIGHFFRRRPGNNARLRGGDENIQEGWVRGHWWYRLAHVYQRWRSILLGLSVLPGYFPWHNWQARCRHAGEFTLPSTHHRLP